MIKMIGIKYLRPHPDNPRQDLGDLTELAESIKVRGVMQNLTVVKTMGNITGTWVEGVYTVVIGHRRLEAAKLAGLTEVPCVIAEMTEQEQVATMLLENMQRSDLTVYEQAQGFQMMLDLGETISDISRKTGFSESTVRRRTKLLELDQEKFRETANRNVTLMDYAELEKIENIELRNKVLESIGTPNFNYELKRAVEEEQKEKWFAGAIEVLKTFAVEVEEMPRGCRYIESYYASRQDEINIPENAGEEAYLYKISKYGYITLYGEPRETEEDAAEKEKREREKARYNALEEISKRTYALRTDFIKNISNKKAKETIDEIVKFAIHSMLGYKSLDIEDLATLLDITLSEDDAEAMDALLQELPSQPYRYLLLAVYSQLDSIRENYHRWDSAHCENENLDNVYTFLEVFGYEMSDEEKAMRDGTHELFNKESE